MKQVLMGGVSYLPLRAAEDGGAGGATPTPDGGEDLSRGTPTPPLAQPTPTPEPEPEPQPEAEPEPETDPGKKPWFTKRIDELTGKWRNTERERDALKAERDLLQAQLEAKGAQPEPEPEPGKPQPQTKPQRDPNLVPKTEVERLAREEAARQMAERQFNEDCNKVFAEGKAEFKDFDKKVAAFGQLTSNHTDPQAFGRYMNLVSASLELGAEEAAKVLYHLGSDLDEAERVMALPPVKLGVELTKISSRVNPTKPVTSAPPPIRPVRGAARAEPRLDDPNLSTAEWIKLRNKQLAEKRANGGA